jgi:hypothetical protein
MNTSTLPDPDLEERLRTTLHAVASTVEDMPGATTPGNRGRRLALAVGAVGITTAVAAAAVIRMGPEYVDVLPPDNVVVAGEADGGRYWLVEMTRTVGCPEPPTGVELIKENSNLVGQEWNTSGLGYGEPVDQGCRYDASAALRDPATAYSGGSFSGDTFLVTYAVHPDVTAVRLTIDGNTTTVPVHDVDGAGYSIFEVPAGTDSYTVELLIGDTPVPGSRQTRAVPTPSGS